MMWFWLAVLLGAAGYFGRHRLTAMRDWHPVARVANVAYLVALAVYIGAIVIAVRTWGGFGGFIAALVITSTLCLLGRFLLGRWPWQEDDTIRLD